MRIRRFDTICLLRFCLCLCGLLAGCGDDGGRPGGRADSPADRTKAETRPAVVREGSRDGQGSAAGNATARPGLTVPPAATVAPPATIPPAAAAIVTAARGQVGRTTIYDPAYAALAYPGGDVPIERGVCSDVVVRALREALGMDLQKLLHEDMRAAFAQYPQKWGLRGPDRNIDHRRVPNLARYFERTGRSLPVTARKEDYLPGDLVAVTVPPNLPHIMVVSDRTSPTGVPLVIHNIGRGAQEEDRLFEFPITGHYRVAAASPQVDHR